MFANMEQWNELRIRLGATSRHGDVGDVGAPRLIGPCDSKITVIRTEIEFMEVEQIYYFEIVVSSTISNFKRSLTNSSRAMLVFIITRTLSPSVFIAILVNSSATLVLP